MQVVLGPRMNCPQSHGSLETIHLHSVAIHRCPICRGLWCKKRELCLIKNKEALGDYAWINLDLWRDAGKFRAAHQQRYDCPEDGQPMTTVRYSNFDVTVDICSSCEGIWLDPGEWAQIVAYLDDFVNSQSTQDYLKDIREEFREVIVGGPEGRLGALRGMGKLLYLLELRFSISHPQLVREVASLPR